MLQVDEFRSNWIDSFVQTNLLSDEISFVQFGAEDEVNYNSFSLSDSRPSAWSKFPDSENPDSLFKYTSLNM